ncbi:MAG: penicillin-binding protein 1C [Bacteroidia bacterium]|nr:penicillin-binding protein 1C [Bacteroidia bacterium]
MQDSFVEFVSVKPLRSAFRFFLSGLFIYFLVCLPAQLFKVPYSSVITDEKGTVLSARIASDGQWRFPSSGKVSEKFKTCIVQFEDKNFDYHPGVDLLAMSRAFTQNISKRKIVSGGSTITMQVIRLARKKTDRSYFEKFIEMIWAGRLTLTNSKDEVLSLYATHAPFGSNIVGIEAAAWRYFGRSPELLSWAENATLAVLPNAPSLIYPGRNQQKLLNKRNRLLQKLNEKKIIDDETYQLAIAEQLPEKAFSIPRAAPHLLDRSIELNGEGQRVKTTLNADLQRQITDLVNAHSFILSGNEIHNAAAIVIEINSGKIISYVGNCVKTSGEDHGNDVDVIIAPRSTGSLLKPFLYSSMLNDGVILPNTLVPDIPTQIGGFTPQNFNLTYDGAVPAKRALSRSLNIPCVRMLQQYGLEKFYDRLKKFGMTTFNRPASDYGMSLILGGGEGKLIEMAGAYAAMARTLKKYNSTGNYFENEFRLPVFISKEKNEKQIISGQSFVNAASVYLTFEAMAEVSRPDIEASWQRLGSGQKIAWKTGTSFGFRDGWAIGLNTDYVVAVWVGNADGEGRPGLTGISAAAPLLFRIFGVLPKTNNWFTVPLNDMKKIEVCKNSGYRASVNCAEKIMQLVPKNSENTTACPFHKIIQLDLSGKFRVNGNCVAPSEMQQQAWFVLPPAIEYYFKSKNAFYNSLPPYKKGCEPTGGKSMEMIYPRANAKIFVPLEMSGEQGKTVFELAHRIPASTVFWDLDGIYLGTTNQFHQMSLNPEKGAHVLTLSDENGEMLTIPFEVISEKKKNANE